MSTSTTTCSLTANTASTGVRVMSKTHFLTDHIVLPHDIPGSSSPLQKEAQVPSSSLRALTLHVRTNIAHGEFDGTDNHVSISSITFAGLQGGFPDKHAFDAP